MKQDLPQGPQHSLLFRVIGFFYRLQMGYLFRNMENPRYLVVAFVFMAGATALGTITLVAYLPRLPLLFPPLGPTAFILFHTPMSANASPRNVILAHTLAVFSGLVSLHLFAQVLPQANLTDPSMLNGPRVVVIALAMGLVGEHGLPGKSCPSLRSDRCHVAADSGSPLF